MPALRSAVLPLRSHSILRQAAVAGSSTAPVSRRQFSHSRTAQQESDTSPLDLAGQAVEASASSPSAFSSFLSSASDAFLALPDHLPFHPSYATSIVLLTLALRCSNTLPLTVWQRKRLKRVQEEVIPRVKAYMEEAKYDLRAQFRRAGKDYTDYTKELNERTKAEFKKLSSKYSCATLPTILLPPAVHLPVFISTTFMLRESCQRSLAALDMETGTITSLAAEAFAWCPSLADMDPSAMLPVLVGLTAFANVEIQQASRARVAQATEVSLDDPAPAANQAKKPAARPTAIRPGKARPAAVDPRSTTRRSASTAAAPATPQPLSTSAIRTKALTNVLRGASVMFIPIAAFTPVVSNMLQIATYTKAAKQAVNIYWLTSNLFSIVQNLCIGYADKQRRRNM